MGGLGAAWNTVASLASGRRFCPAGVPLKGNDTVFAEIQHLRTQASGSPGHHNPVPCSYGLYTHGVQ